jgi:hypothetical protein
VRPRRARLRDFASETQRREGAKETRGGAPEFNAKTTLNGDRFLRVFALKLNLPRFFAEIVTHRPLTAWLCGWFFRAVKLRPFVVLSFALVLAASSGRAATPFRLFEVFAIRYIKDTSGATIQDRGAFNALGEFRHDIYNQLSAGTIVPPEQMNRPLLPFTVWPGYDVLGREALANFDLGQSIVINGAAFFVLAVASDAKVAVGTVPNLSARGTVASGGDPLIGGFVVEDRPRRVLIRGVGPTLSAFNVVAPLANPALTLFRQGAAAAIATNDDWGQQANATAIETTALASGAFALARDSKDAALLLELPPGAYTAQLGTADATSGSALLEIYILP